MLKPGKMNDRYLHTVDHCVHCMAQEYRWLTLMKTGQPERTDKCMCMFCGMTKGTALRWKSDLSFFHSLVII